LSADLKGTRTPVAKQPVAPPTADCRPHSHYCDAILPVVLATLAWLPLIAAGALWGGEWAVTDLLYLTILPQVFIT